MWPSGAATPSSELVRLELPQLGGKTVDRGVCVCVCVFVCVRYIMDQAIDCFPSSLHSSAVVFINEVIQSLSELIQVRWEGN